VIRLVPRALLLAVIATFANVSQAAPAPRAENAFLSQTEAMARSARVSNVDYVLAFELTGKETFSGTTTLTFDLKDKDSALTIDLDKASITALTVNGKQLTPQYNNWFITIAAQDLLKGRNSISVSYTRPHSTNGEGLHRMQDPADGKVYTYSHFEPAAAHQMFALFDQPDLKATYTLTVSAPSDWQVVSTTRESKIEDAGASRRWTFPATKKLSAYNFSLHAGPYKVWEDNSGKYPMRLFARQSLAAQISPADWFKYTKAGLSYFDEYFGIPYQFGKYDQILVPDFLYGAMENAGAVTFAERAFLHKAAMTAAQRESLAHVILHEMAHQWFGDMVTMSWWNGVWLNESFASFMATKATAETTEFTHAWQSFNIDGKQGAYVQDAGPATHAIEVPVPSSANAFDNIDAITYSKGASTLNQLRHRLGEDKFRKGVHNYLVKYQFKNARLEDFLAELGKAAGRDMRPWTDEWLNKAGVNTIAADYRCVGNKITSFTLRQEAPNPSLPTLREQHVQVATFRQEGGKLLLNKNVAVTYKGAATPIPAMVGTACPDLVYPNYQDWGYAKVQLDQRSFATATRYLGGADDALLRSMLWQNLWDGVRETKFPLDAFIEAGLTNAPAEKNYTLLSEVLDKLAESKNYLVEMNASPAYVASTLAALQKMAWAGVQANGNDSNFARLWFDLYQGSATDKAGLEKLAAILSGATVIEGVPLNQDLRWSLIATLARYDYPGSAALIEAELARDKSDSGQSAALRATVLRPDPKIKEEWLAKIADLKTTLPFSRVRTAMGSLFPTGQAQLSEASAQQRLNTLAAVDKAAEPVYMRSYAWSMIPHSCTPESVARLAQALTQAGELSTGTKRALADIHERDQRCVAIKRAMTMK
jgi:aminopeptidase N